MSVNQIQAEEVSVAVGVLPVVEEQTEWSRGHEPHLDVERLVHVVQGREL